MPTTGMVRDDSLLTITMSTSSPNVLQSLLPTIPLTTSPHKRLPRRVFGSIGTDLEKMSEIGAAVYDPRVSPSSSKTTTNTCTSTSNTTLEDLAKSTTASHFLVEEWKHETETTCKAFWHRDRKKKTGTLTRRDHITASLPGRRSSAVPISRSKK
ncbi:hypothetical protein GE21DRAFT_5340 [Neurospora crassa]|uniref:Uncharacterized protein n=1 Tax=Neurospora crassa (strain ATCC 24698 / 74-OR23-1A / CBS 708.71 / DSM 1257 / FGSC 987) TaxID=367110 RepID=Q7S1E3_NEUCR|nr:hypothetical protein NCU04892 [Neurospora crassa OR74A]EAA29165.1 hypothetical protein NCU04892 [Neurospora crassa OR74A]KHE78849.1 hypothetical protein GE21DRAFT_5340 [Neurospora crassa]|eukprot:XP_958401.1 hypothetical protein NCU04892 [Neurospora crassa OR74A]